ncbi:BPL-N domain-containing protein [Amycolatopsis minnesotensis]|uniref:BPL-N domain-containing protein n=1 Tax=Amycolatopsis minnesotensis TaxID=337894 RepID=A0ABN2QTF0_9PSEU
MRAVSRRWLLGSAGALAGGALLGCSGEPGPGGSASAGAAEPPAPVAVVYRGPATNRDCAESVAKLLRESSWSFEVRFAGPREPIEVTAETLRGAALYAQPGGGGLAEAYRHVRGYAGDIRRYVAGGGRYLGFCLGGYLAGKSPGFGLLTGDAARYIDSPGATVESEDDTVVPVDWRGRTRYLYFQDGPYFTGSPGGTVLAKYPNALTAAVVAPHGAGRVAVVGPHPEATADWYADAGLRNPAGVDPGPGHDLVDALMRA